MGFNPRLNLNGMLNNFYWYSDNPFYQSNYGLPNCTCYAYGRFWEISDPKRIKENKPINLPLSDGGKWFGQAVEKGYYQTGQKAKLGAVACFSRNGGGAGHVAIVEAIDEFENITTSNSAYNSKYFYISNLQKSNNYNTSSYTFLGFIYNPFAENEESGNDNFEDYEEIRKFSWQIFTNIYRKKRQ